MTKNIWVTSDTHFNHGNIIDYCERPFKNSREMDEALIENWNKVVKPSDKVYHLGDVYMKASKGYIESILQRLNGHKRLILGNHDNGKDQILQRYFEKIQVLRWFKEYGLVFSHLPMHDSSIKKGYINVHGHIHEKQSPSPLHINVSVEQTNYTPISIEELMKKVDFNYEVKQELDEK